MRSGRLVFVEHHSNWLNAFENYFVTLECAKSFHTSGFSAMRVIDRVLENPKNTNIVLVTDYSMQVMDGLELCKKYQNIMNIKKVIYSNIIEDDIIRKSLADGSIDCYFKKDLEDSLEKLYNYIVKQLPLT